jgi:hypothetical protein
MPHPGEERGPGPSKTTMFLFAVGLLVAVGMGAVTLIRLHGL